MAQAVESLSSNCEALNSNPSTTKKEEKRNVRLGTSGSGL
jgi:hypothetical protein